MSKKLYEEEKIRAIAEKIREKTNTETTYNTAEMSNGIDEVYEAGKYKEWSDFWDDFQMAGTRSNYSKAFYCNSSNSWTVRTLRPKYDIICEGDASYCFFAWENSNNTFDLGTHFKNLGRKLDTSKATNLYAFFAYGYDLVGELPTISCESAGANTAQLFRGVAITKIEKVIVTEQTIYTDWFTYCNNLTDIAFEGTIANNIGFPHSPLSGESVVNILYHLRSNYDDENSGYVAKDLTITLNAESWARGEELLIEQYAEESMDFVEMYSDIRQWVADIRGWNTVSV